MGCSTTLAKMFLFVFNIIFFLLGCACLGVGIWLAVSKNTLISMINLATKDVNTADQQTINNYLSETPLIQSAAYVLIAIGVFTFVVGFCGCCGAMKESKCLLTVYAIAVSFVVIIEIAAAILGGVYKSRITDKAGEVMLKLQNIYFVSYDDFSKYSDRPHSQITSMINYAQVMFRCCGMVTSQDVAASTSWKNSTRTYNNQTMQIPLTCCALESSKRTDLLEKAQFSDFFQNPGKYLQDSSCPLNSAKAMNATCFSQVEAYVKSYTVPIIGVGVGIALFEILVVLIACCLVRSLDQKL